MREIQRKKKFLNDLARSGRADFIDEIDSIVYFLQRDGDAGGFRGGELGFGVGQDIGEEGGVFADVVVTDWGVGILFGIL